MVNPLQLDGVTANFAPLFDDIVNPNVGTVEHTFEHVRGIHHFRVTLTNFVLAVSDSAGEYGGAIFMRLPNINLVILNAEANLTVVKGNAAGGINAADPFDFGIGTAVASNNTLSTTMQNIIPKTTVATSALSVLFQNSSFSAIGASKELYMPDSTTNDIYLNAASAGAVMTADDTLTFTGTVDFWLISLGNVNHP